MRKVLMVVPLVAVLGFGSPALAATKPVAANGERCTIVGTSKSDTLTGTGRADVICGLGGNDTIRGGGGRDTLDGGSGNDRIDGDQSNDKIWGGIGDDAISGGSGNDSLDGGDDNDRINGGSGDDVVNAGADADQVWGSSGDDRITGGTGNDDLDGGADDDRVNGSSGNDRILGGSGSDAMWGGSGGDALRGGAGRDRMYGQDGNDDLDGADGENGESSLSQADTADGGAGTNWCIPGPYDTSWAYCKTDGEAPKIVGFTFLPATVDVSERSGTSRVRIHVTDDTGAGRVAASGAPFGVDVSAPVLVSGTIRDGWWEAGLRIARFANPGSYSFDVGAWDRIGFGTNSHAESALTVVNRNPDLAGPVLSDLKVTPDTVDTRGADGSVTVTARATDNLSGVNRIEVNFLEPQADGSTKLVMSGTLNRISGTALDGRYSYTFPIYQHWRGGTWQLALWMTDRAQPNAYYPATGPSFDVLASPPAEPSGAG